MSMLPGTMIVLLIVGAILLSALIQRVIRRGPGSESAEAPASLRLSAYFLIMAGTAASEAPLLMLVFDAFAIRSLSELLVFVLFLVVSQVIILAPWIWLRRIWRRSSRSACAFVVGTAAANIAIALVLYRGFLSGDADAQDGIVVLIVPLLQLVVTAVSVLLWRPMEQNSRATPAPG